jgi:4-hydroxybenzoate polyprenyltransferase
MFRDYISLIRPHQYLKNLIIFSPLVFSVKITDPVLLLKTVIAFISFSLIASSIYIFNDIKDLEEDKKHPVKSKRPIAAGKIKIFNGLILMGILFLAGCSIAYYLNIHLLLIILIYFTINIFYSLGLKHFSIIDLLIISTGFVLRVFAGSAVANVETTNWIIIMTFLLAMFLGLAKRRDDVMLANTGTKTRKNIDGYNLIFIDSSMVIMASIVIVAYILYTISPEITHKFNSNYLYLTTIFVIAGIIRYMQITFVEKNSGSPTKILIQDRFLQITIILWLTLFISLIY